MEEKSPVFELFLEHAKSKAEATRVFSLLPDKYIKHILDLSMRELLSIKGIGRKAALLVMEVAADLAGKR